MRHDFHFDPASRCWILAIPDTYVRLKPGRPNGEAAVSADVLNEALDQIDERANARLREARRQIATNQRRRWRSKQPRRVLS